MHEAIKTPHINPLAKIAKTVLMPGDPLRAKYIADNFLENVELFNEVRGMLGYTGSYKGQEISVMGSGMGMPSIGIYSYELFSVYGVENIIRIGSAGSYTKDLKLYDVFLCTEAFAESTFALMQSENDSNVLASSAELNAALRVTAAKLNLPLQEGCVHSSDVFYYQKPQSCARYVAEYGCFCVEMESFALFNNAQALGKKAACLVTISDNLVTKEATSSDERQTAFNKMIELALELVGQEAI